MESRADMSDPAQPPDLGAGPEGGETSGGAPEPPPNLTSNRRLQHTQAEVNQVVDILHDNMSKFIERDTQLSSLDDKADSLHESAKMFENSTTALARKYWCQNMKMMIILGLICGIAAVAIIGDVTHSFLSRPFQPLTAAPDRVRSPQPFTAAPDRVRSAGRMALDIVEEILSVGTSC